MHPATHRELMNERIADLHRRGSHARTVPTGGRDQKARSDRGLPGGLTTATVMARRMLAILANRQPARHPAGPPANRPGRRRSARPPARATHTPIRAAGFQDLALSR